MLQPFRTKLAIDPVSPMGHQVFFEPQAVILLKQRRDRAFERIQSQQVGGETVQSSDLGLFDILKGGFCPADDLILRQTVPCPHLIHLAGCLILSDR
jgi:hypothetical protein